MSAELVELRGSARQVGLVGRGVLLVLCSSIGAGKGTAGSDLLWLAALIPVAVISSHPQLRRIPGLLLLALESGICAITVLGTGSGASVFLPYLLAPAFSGALLAGVVGALVPPGAAALTFLVGRAVGGGASSLRTFTTDVALWVVLSGFVGLVTAWVERIALTAHALDPYEAQKAAHDLISRLHAVARRMPGSLDPTSTAESMLLVARATAPYTEGAVLVLSPGARLVALAWAGHERPDWDLSLSGDGAVAEAWALQEPQVGISRLRRAEAPAPSGSSVVIPLTLGLRTVGLLVLESETPGVWTSATARALARDLREASLQLETGLLFDEVRALAMTEERHRVAREIHDGIAQELVFLGYSLDNVIGSAGFVSPAALAELLGIREQVTRLISELRLSLFDLRGELDSGPGLGTALSDHVRFVATHTDLRVHLSLTEATTRLRAPMEVELLRIAQEAVANVRKHAGAQNLWVSCVVEPPHAMITVEDDGIGLSHAARTGSFGLAIMQERASRLKARLVIDERPGGGTRVTVTVASVLSSS